jgi:hypothetical protein
MLRALWGTAPKGEGCATRRATDRLANIGVGDVYALTVTRRCWRRSVPPGGDLKLRKKYPEITLSSSIDSTCTGALIYTVMAEAEGPLFDPSLKKRSKKKQVAFSEDPLADADPTVPAPSLDDTIDLGPRTVHEQMKQSEAGAGDVPSEPKEVREEDDFKAMFGDLKKKKKKKEIPLDLVCPTSPSLLSCGPTFIP